MNQAVLTEPLVPPQITVKDFYMTGGPPVLNSNVPPFTKPSVIDDSESKKVQKTKTYFITTVDY